MIENKLKNKIILKLFFLTFLFFIMILITSCSLKKNNFLYELPKQTIINLNENYIPEIKVSGDTEINSIQLKDPIGDNIIIGEDYSFTANKIGSYEYIIVFSNKTGSNYTAKFTVTVGDIIKPEITSMIKDKQGVELGNYISFEEDLNGIIVQDNYTPAESIIKKVYAVKYGENILFINENGIGQYFLDKIGTYTILLKVIDNSGNFSEGFYSIITVDTTAPVIDELLPQYSWIGNGTIEIPTVSVSDISQYEVSVSVSKNGENINISNNKIINAELGIYNLTYTATDNSGNLSEPLSVILEVLEDGEINEFSDNFQNSMWQSQDLELSFNNEYMSAKSVQNKATITTRQNFKFNDWTDFDYLTMDILNFNAMDVSIAIKIVTLKSEYYLESLKPSFAIVSDNYLNPAVKTTTFEIYLGDYNIDFIDIIEINFELNASNGFNLAFDNIQLKKFAELDFDISGVKDIYNINEQINFPNLYLGDQISYIDSSAIIIYYEDIKLTTLAIDSNFVFINQGEYLLEWVLTDKSGKDYKKTKIITVTDVIPGLSFTEDTLIGEINKEYTLRNFQITDADTAVLVSVKPINELNYIQITGNIFTPEINGLYLVRYEIIKNDIIVNTIFNEIYILSESEIMSFERSGSEVHGSESTDIFIKNIEYIDDSLYTKNGNTSALYSLDANGYMGSYFKGDSTKYTIVENANAFCMWVKSDKVADIKILAIFDQTQQVYSKRISINKGWNCITWLINAERIADGNEAINITESGLSGLLIFNQSDYDIKLYIDSVELTSITEIDISNIVYQNKEYSVSYGMEFTIPSPFKLYTNLQSEIEVLILDSEFNIFKQSDIGSKIKFSEFGDYILRYIFKDAFGLDQIVDYKIIAEKNLLSFIVDTSAFYAGKTFPAPLLTSDLFTEEQLKQTEIRIFAKSENKEWSEYGIGETFDKADYYQIKYIATCGNYNSEMIYDVYVNDPDIFLSAEALDGEFKNKGTPYDYGYLMLQQSDKWSNSGRYSLLMTNGYKNGWAGYTYTTLVTVGETNKISLWINSDINTDFVLQWMTDKSTGWDVDDFIRIDFKLEKGIHYYEFKFNIPEKLKGFTKIKIFMVRDELANFSNIYLDDIAFDYKVELEFEDEFTLNALNVITGVEAILPLPELFSTEFTETELKEAVWTVSYKLKDSTENAAGITATDGQYKITFVESGKYEIIYKVVLNDFIIIKSYEINAVPIKINVSLPAGILNTGDTILLNEPTVIGVTTYDTTVSIGISGTEARTELILNGDNKYPYTFTQSGYYTVRYLVEGENKTNYVDYELYINSYELFLSAEATDGEFKNKGTPYENGFIMLQQSDKWSNSGRYSLVMQEGFKNSWAGYTYSTLATVGETNKVSLWINSNVNTTFIIQLMTDKSTGWNADDFVKVTFEVTSGIHYYELDFGILPEKQVGFTKISIFMVRDDLFKTDTIFYLDDIAFDYKVELEFEDEFTLDALNVITGVETILPLPELVSTEFTETELKEAVWTVSYKLKNVTEDATAIAATDGQYKITFVEGGTYEITYKTVLGDYEYTAAYGITVKSIVINTSLPAGVYNTNDTILLNVPAVTGVTTYDTTVSIGISGTEERTELSLNGDNKYPYTFNQSGYYTVRYLVEGENKTNYVDYELYVNNPGVFLSAEATDGEFKNKGTPYDNGFIALKQTTEWSNSGKYSLAMYDGYRNSWAGYTYTTLPTVGETNKVSLWINSTVDTTFIIQMMTDKSTGWTADDFVKVTFEVTSGIHYYELDFGILPEKQVGFTKISIFMVRDDLHKEGIIYLDDIVFDYTVKSIVINTSLPAGVYNTNDTILLNVPDVTVTGVTTYNTTVSIGISGTEARTELSLNGDNKYPYTFTQSGYYMVRYFVESGTISKYSDYELYVNDPDIFLSAEGTGGEFKNKGTPYNNGFIALNQTTEWSNSGKYSLAMYDGFRNSWAGYTYSTLATVGVTNKISLWINSNVNTTFSIQFMTDKATGWNAESFVAVTFQVTSGIHYYELDLNLIAQNVGFTKISLFMVRDELAKTGTIFYLDDIKFS